MSSVALNIIDVITDSTEEPITLSEAKNWLRVDTSDDDTKISMIISGAIDELEQYLRHPLITKTIKYTASTLLYSEESRCYFLRLPYNVTTLNSIKVVDELNVENTLASTEYSLYGNTIYLNHTYDLRDDHSYIVEFTAGIASNALATPNNIKIALLNLVKLNYDGECSGMSREKILKSIYSYTHIDYLGL